MFGQKTTLNSLAAPYSTFTLCSFYGQRRRDIAKAKGFLLQSVNRLYQSAGRLYKKAPEGLNVSRKAVKEWLKTQDTYTWYKPIVRRHDYRQTYVKYLGEQIQMDLVDMGKYKRENGRILQDTDCDRDP